MKNSILMVLLLLICASFAYGDEIDIPKFKSKPITYKSRYEGKLLVGDRSSSSLTFWVNISGANGHQCYLAGNAESADNESYRYVDAASNCILDIVLVGKSAVLIDLDNACHESNCGSRAFLNGAVFHRSK